MGYPRSHLVDPDTPGVYHCVSRCVRRAFLCGVDKFTRRSYEHRRQFLEDRIHLLAQQFAVSIHAYAVMSNHVHLVIATDPALPKAWSDEEVHARWRRVMPKRAVIKPPSEDAQAGTAESQPLPQASPADIARWRERLGSLSWFMRRLLEPLARKANREDECTGHFWESRFFCQALLDDRAILAGCVYVDLNPFRAGIGRALEELPHTGIALRIAAEKQAQAALASTETSTAPEERASTEPLPHLPPVAGHNRLSNCLPIHRTVPRPGRLDGGHPDPGWTAKSIWNFTASRRQHTAQGARLQLTRLARPTHRHPRALAHRRRLGIRTGMASTQEPALGAQARATT